MTQLEDAGRAPKVTAKSLRSALARDVDERRQSSRLSASRTGAHWPRTSQHLVVGSIRETVPSTALATQTAPAP